MKLSIALLISVFIHVVLLLVLSTHQPEPQKPVEPQAVIINAQLIMATQPKPQPQKAIEKPTPALIQEPMPAPSKEQMQLVSNQPSIQPQTKSSIDPQESIKTPTKPQNLPQASFDPYASLDKLIERQTHDFINNSSDERAQLKARNNAINNIPSSITSINSSNQSQIKAIFETAQQIDPNTRVVNYNGTCVQIQRELDFNGFSQFKWTGTTLDCGANKDMKNQLKQSLAKFVK